MISSLVLSVALLAAFGLAAAPAEAAIEVATETLGEPVQLPSGSVDYVARLRNTAASRQAQVIVSPPSWAPETRLFGGTPLNDRVQYHVSGAGRATNATYSYASRPAACERGGETPLKAVTLELPAHSTTALRLAYTVVRPFANTSLAPSLQVYDLGEEASAPIQVIFREPRAVGKFGVPITIRAHPRLNSRGLRRIRYGRKLTIRGRTDEALRGRRIAVGVRRDDRLNARFLRLRHPKVRDDGSFVTRVRLRSPGLYSLSAHFDGSSKLASDRSCSYQILQLPRRPT